MVRGQACVAVARQYALSSEPVDLPKMAMWMVKAAELSAGASSRDEDVLVRIADHGLRDEFFLRPCPSSVLFEAWNSRMKICQSLTGPGFEQLVGLVDDPILTKDLAAAIVRMEEHSVHLMMKCAQCRHLADVREARELLVTDSEKVSDLISKLTDKAIPMLAKG